MGWVLLGFKMEHLKLWEIIKMPEDSEQVPCLSQRNLGYMADTQLNLVNLHQMYYLLIIIQNNIMKP